MDAGRVEAFLAHSRAAYVADLIAVGIPVAVAEETAGRQQDEAFPHGRPAPGHLLFEAVVDGARGGYVWIGPQPSAAEGYWWVWDVEVDAALRGRGVGRAVMTLAEAEVRARDGRELGLNVFGDNVVARRLYESLGYVEASIRMRKPL
jgi:ribosomal protein S18 acetylase RimI-like enzyme